MFGKPGGLSRTGSWRTKDPKMRISNSSSKQSTQEKQTNDEDLNQTIMQSLIDRHFRSPELRQLAQRVILSTHPSHIETPETKGSQRPHDTRVSRRPSAPRRDLPKYSSNSLHRPKVVGTTHKRTRSQASTGSSTRAQVISDKTTKQPSKSTVRQNTNTRQVFRKPIKKDVRQQATIAPKVGTKQVPRNMQTITLKDYANKEQVDDMKRKLDELSNTLLLRQTQSNDNINQTSAGGITIQLPTQVSSEDEEDWGDFGDDDIDPAKVDTEQDGLLSHSMKDSGPLLLEFHRSQKLDNETQVGQMVFDAANQRWVNTIQEEEDDVMAGFSSSDESDTDLKPNEVEKGSRQTIPIHARKQSGASSQTQDLFIEHALQQCTELVGNFRSSENNHRYTNLTGNPFEDPEMNDDWVRKMAHQYTVDIAKRLAGADL